MDTVAEGSGVEAYNSDPTTKKVQLTVTAARTDEVGRWRVVAVIDGMESEPAGSYRVVTREVNG